MTGAATYERVPGSGASACASPTASSTSSVIRRRSTSDSCSRRTQRSRRPGEALQKATALVRRPSRVHALRYECVITKAEQGRPPEAHLVAQRAGGVAEQPR